MEKATPFDFDLELLMLNIKIRDIFGEKALENQSIKDMLIDFGSDPMLFVQVWDTINYNVEQNMVEIYD